MSIYAAIQKHSHRFHPLFFPDLYPGNTCRLDLSEGNRALASMQFADTVSFGQAIFGLMQSENCTYAYGGYLENRDVYQRSPLFAGTGTPRSVHLGVDVWTRAGTQVYLPLGGRIHSFRDNSTFGDYGPTIVVEHLLESERFFTLYGHLNRSSIEGLSQGMAVQAGNVLCQVGDAPENGDWPPHLHFQVITDMRGQEGDFPGVSRLAELPVYRKLCIDPAPFFGKLHSK